MVGQGFLFTLPHEFFDSAECVGAAKAAEPELSTAADARSRYVVADSLSIGTLMLIRSRVDFELHYACSRRKQPR
jgi:hypothetical protein